MPIPPAVVVRNCFPYLSNLFTFEEKADALIKAFPNPAHRKSSEDMTMGHKDDIAGLSSHIIRGLTDRFIMITFSNVMDHAIQSLGDVRRRSTCRPSVWVNRGRPVHSGQGDKDAIVNGVGVLSTWTAIAPDVP